MPDRDIRDELPSYADWPTVFGLRRPVAGLLAALLLRAKNLGRMTDAQLPHRRQSPLRARLAAPGADPHRRPREPRPPAADRRSQRR
jgi:hypothetical protein